MDIILSLVTAGKGILTNSLEQCKCLKPNSHAIYTCRLMFSLPSLNDHHLMSHHVKRPSEQICVCRRSFLTIHARSGLRRRIAVTSAQSVKMLQSVAARWCCTQWFGNRKFTGGHPSKLKRSETLLYFIDHMTCGDIDLDYRTPKNSMS